jgi:tetratricopeptide (TPR) repeat protein
LLALRRPQEAKGAVSTDSPSIEERIVLGRALAELGQPEEARAALESAAEGIARGQTVGDRWLAELSSALAGSMAVGTAAQVAQTRAARAPRCAEAHRSAVQLLEAAGDPEAAARQAQVAVSLDPSSTEDLRSLARNLTAAGEPARALPYWELLVHAGSADPLDWVACALQAGQVEAAQAHCARILETEPQAAAASVLLARCLTARGEHAGAEARLRQVLADHPDQVEAHLALAEALTAAGQDQAAGDSLFAVCQALPQEPRLRLALGKWLRANGRPSEAVQLLNPGEAGVPPVESLVEFGEAALEVGEQQSALQAFRRAVERQPGNWRARLGLARAYAVSGDVIEAGERLGELPKSAPAEALIQAARIGILAAEAGHAADRIPVAVEHLTRAAAKSPGDPAVELWTARALEAQGKPAEALATYQRCLAPLAGKNADAYGEALLGIGRSAIATGELALALSTLEQAQKRFPTSAEILRLLSQAYGAARLPEKAIEAAERAVGMHGRDPGAWKTLGRARTAAGDLQGALQAYQGLSAIESASPDGWMELARAAQTARVSEVARKALAEALLRGRRSLPVLTEAAELLEEMGSPQSALRMLQAAATVEPQHRPALARLAELSGRLGQLETAQGAWKRLAALEPENPTAHRKSAEALWGLGRSAEAVAAWQRSLELDPRDAEARRALGRAHVQVGEVQQALNHYRAAIELSPDDPSFPLEAGLAAMRHGSQQEAVGLLAEAVNQDPRSPEAWSGLGECCVLLGEWSKAEQALSRAHDLMARSPRVAALRVFAALGLGDLGQAVAFLDQAVGAVPAESGELIWIARALLRMGQWSQAVEILQGWKDRSQDDAVRQALAELRVSLAEAAWVLGQTGAEVSAAEAARLAAASAAQLSELQQLRERALTHPGSVEALQSHMQRRQEGTAAQSLAIGWLNAGQPEAALQAAEALRPIPYAFDWRTVIGAIALDRLGRAGAALETLEFGAFDPIVRPLADALAGRLYASRGDRRAAIASWNRALGARPQEPGWHYALAELYLEGADQDSALPHLQQAVELSPGQLPYRLRLARVLAACGHGAEAVACFKLALDRVEPSLEDLLEGGEVALASNAAEQAFEWFERAQQVAPGHPRALVGSARAAMALGKNRKARERIEAALKSAPHDPQVRLGQGEILEMQRDYPAALQALNQARGLSGALRSRLIQAKSRTLMALGQGEQAEHGLLDELEQSGQDPGLWFPLAKIRQARGEMAAAAEAAAQAVRLAPLNPDYRLGLAHICRQTGNLDRALDELARARELAPNDPRMPLEQGMVYEDRRDYRRALESYRRAIELDNRCTQAYFRSGLVLKLMKSYPQAGQMLKRAAELAPIDREVMHQLAAVRALELVHGPATGAIH